MDQSIYINWQGNAFGIYYEPVAHISKVLRSVENDLRKFEEVRIQDSRLSLIII